MMRMQAMLMACLMTGVMVPFSRSAIAAAPVNAPAVVDLSQANSQITARNLPAQTIRKIKLNIQKRDKVAIGKIKLVGAQTRTWDGCLGLAKPNTVCTQIGISGWQVILSGPDNRFWVYHVDQNGTRMGFNALASVRTKSQIPAPRFVDRPIAPSADNVLFQSAMITGFAPSYNAIELKANGDNYLLTSRQIAPKIGKPRVIKRLTAKQVQPFLNLLNKNSFSHFDNISYFNNSRIAADAAAFQLSGYGATMEYTSGDQDQLPPKLGAIVRAWEDLIQ